MEQKLSSLFEYTKCASTVSQSESIIPTVTDTDNIGECWSRDYYEIMLQTQSELVTKQSQLETELKAKEEKLKMYEERFERLMEQLTEYQVHSQHLSTPMPLHSMSNITIRSSIYNEATSTENSEYESAYLDDEYSDNEEKYDHGSQISLVSYDLS